MAADPNDLGYFRRGEAFRYARGKVATSGLDYFRRAEAFRAAIQSASTVTTTRNQTGAARIRVTVTRTITGVARMRVTVSRAQTGVSRIRATVSQSQSGVARIRVSTTRAQTCVSRIRVSTTRNQTGVARIRATATKNQTSVARVRKTVTQTESGVARVRKSVAKTQTGKSNIAILPSYYHNIGNPLNARWDSSDVNRSIQDLQYFSGSGKIYVGAGTTGNASIRIDLWSVTVSDNSFTKEISLMNAEMNDRFRICNDGQLYIPDRDDIDGANIYRLESGTWVQHFISVGTTGHGFDVYTFDSKIFLSASCNAGATVAPGGCFISHDDGATWLHTALVGFGDPTANKTAISTFFEIGGSLFACYFTGAGAQVINKYDTGDPTEFSHFLTTSYDDFWPADLTFFLGAPTPEKAKQMNNYVLLLAPDAVNPTKLVKVSQMEPSIITTTINLPDTAYTIDDIVVESQVLFVMAHKTVTGVRTYQVYATTDLSSWVKLLENVSTYQFSSIEYSPGRLYFGSSQMWGSSEYSNSYIFYVDSTDFLAPVPVAGVTRNQTGVSRIRKSVTRNQTGVARMRVSTPRAQTGVARMRVTATRNQTGVARVRVTVSKAQTGKSRIRVSVPKAQTGVAKIQASTTRNQTGVSYMLVPGTTDRPQTGKARLRISITRAQSGVARIRITASKTQTGLSRMRASVPRAQIGKANISVPGTASRPQTGKSRVQKTAQQVLAARSRVQVHTQSSQQARSRVYKTTSRLQLGISHVATQAATVRSQMGVAFITSVDVSLYPERGVSDVDLDKIVWRGTMLFYIATDFNQDEYAISVDGLQELKDIQTRLLNKRVKISLDITNSGFSAMLIKRVYYMDLQRMINTFILRFGTPNKVFWELPWPEQRL